MAELEGETAVPGATQVAATAAAAGSAATASSAAAVQGAGRAGGVVDPIRIPPWLREPFEQAWREAPTVVRVFGILAAVDIVSRGLGILQPRYDFGGLDLFRAWLFLVPHDLWIVLPAILVLHRPDARQATPLVFWGAVVVALVSVVATPLELLGGIDALGQSALSFELAILAAAAGGAGWLLLARGLALIGPARPNDTIAGLANLALGAELLVTLVSFARQLVAIGQEQVLGASIVQLEILDDIVGLASMTAWLYLLWVVLRGAGDLRRPGLATGLAAGAVAVIVVIDVVGGLVGAIGYATNGGFGGLPVVDVSNSLGIVRYGVAEACLVIAFGLGLAEPAVPVAATAG